jgi:hypothetical protein
MPLVIKAILSMAVAVAAVVAMTLLSGTIAILIGGAVVLVAIVAFGRAIMAVAAEPGEKSRR